MEPESCRAQWAILAADEVREIRELIYDTFATTIEINQLVICRVQGVRPRGSRSCVSMRHCDMKLQYQTAQKPD